jgi:ammonia channel protein AmtB
VNNTLDVAFCWGLVACGIWSLSSVGLFKKASINIIENDAIVGSSMNGLFYGGGVYVFLVQLAACASIVIYSGIIAAITLQVLRRIPHGLRKHGIVDERKHAIMRKRRSVCFHMPYHMCHHM